MSGIVWEWCGNWYGNYGSDAQTNPKGLSSGSDRVCRGGSWRYGARHCRVFDRGSRTTGFRSFILGLRLASDA